MNAARLRFLSPLLVLALAACSEGASGGGDPSEGEPEVQGSEVKAAACRGGVLGTDGVNYAPGTPNVARELAASLAPSFVTNGSAFVPGVLRATSSTSPYAYAATLQLSAWSTMSTTSFDGARASGGDLVLRLQGDPAKDEGGKAAKALFDAMTRATQTNESGAIVRRSAKGSVVCASYPGHVQCALGALGHVEQNGVCPK